MTIQFFSHLSQTFSNFAGSAAEHIHSMQTRIPYIFSGRLVSNWQNRIMTTALVTSVVGLAFSFFSGFSLLPIPPMALLGASCIGSYYTKERKTPKSLEKVVEKTQVVQKKLQENINSLHHENNRLQTTNKELAINCERFSSNNEQLAKNITSLQKTNQDLKSTNQALTQQVTNLTLQVIQLSKSADKIREEVILFQKQNDHLTENVHTFDTTLNILQQEIAISRALCTEIEHYLTSHQHDLGNRISELRVLITDLRTNGSTNEKLSHLHRLNQQISTTTNRLHQIKIQYAAEKASLETTREALAQISNELNIANQDFRDNLSTFCEERKEICSQRERLQALVDRILFPPSKTVNLAIPAK